MAVAIKIACKPFKFQGKTWKRELQMERRRGKRHLETRPPRLTKRWGMTWRWPHVGLVTMAMRRISPRRVSGSSSKVRTPRA
jgi:hypothetical protein